MAALTHSEILINYHNAGNPIGMYNYAKTNQLTALNVDGIMMRVNPDWRMGMSSKWVADNKLAPLQGPSLPVEPVPFPVPLVSPIQPAPTVLGPVKVTQPIMDSMAYGMPISDPGYQPSTQVAVGEPAKDNMLLYIGLGVAGLAAFFMMRKK